MGDGARADEDDGQEPVPEGFDLCSWAKVFHTHGSLVGFNVGSCEEAGESVVEEL